jgi:hypothetical protein
VVGNRLVALEKVAEVGVDSIGRGLFGSVVVRMEEVHSVAELQSGELSH